MKIELKKIKVQDIVGENRDWFVENMSTNKATAMDGKLDIRPEYQREFVYNAEKQEAVINTILNGFPLNIMYFVDRKDGTYEVLDGQQRIISICKFARGDFSVSIPIVTGNYDTVNYPNLFKEKQKAFMNYELQVYICEGTEEEKLAWFQVINVAGETLEKQEIRNAIYHSKWLTDAKSLFSRNNCAAKKNYGKYLKGQCERQKYLETVFEWKANAEGLKGKDIVAEYMKKHRNDKNADELWKYFENVFKWVKYTFGEYDDAMKGLDWGIMYNQHKDDILDPITTKKDIDRLMADREVQKKNGIYMYLLTGEEKYLSIRTFDNDDKRSKYEEQEHKCAHCDKPFDFDEMEGDHIIPWSKGGKTEYSNLQMLCKPCNAKKSDK